MRDIDFGSVHKFVINLNSRQDRMEHARKEHEYMGWEVERFPACLDRNGRPGFEGCILSNLKIIEIAKERKLPSVLILEDDIVFMPWAKEVLRDVESIGSSSDSVDLEWDLISLAPTINRRLTLDPKNENRTLVPMHGELPEKRHNERGIFGTSMMLYHESMYDTLLNFWSYEKEWMREKGEVSPWDMFLDEKVYPEVRSYSSSLPVCTQIMDKSSVNGGQEVNNHYLMTYNWNLYIRRICTKWMDLKTAMEARDLGEYSLHCP